jgi:hypothetical protein
MKKNEVEAIINKATSKTVMQFAIFAVLLIAVESYYQQQLSSLIVMSVSISTSLILSTSLLKSTLTDLFAALDKKAKSDKVE